MIDPKMGDWWSGQRLTEIHYRDSSLSGAGVSLHVILPAFSDSEMIWYSMMYGDYDDNILLVGCDRNKASSFERVRYEEKSPVQTIYDEAFPDEYVLTDAMYSTLGLRLEEDGYLADLGKVSCHIYIHDNCFFCIKPVKDRLLGSLIGCILEQHSFYLGQEVDWSRVLPGLTEQLVTLGGIEMQSDPDQQCMWIPELEKRKWPFWKRFRQGTVLIENGQAYFRDAMS